MVALILSWMWLAPLAVTGQPALRPQDLMVLVIGPSSQSIDANEAQVVARLRSLKQSSGFSQLRMATMHFDRPKEASFAQKALGVSKNDLVCLCLVQLDPRTGQPANRLYFIPRVTTASLDAVENMVATWAQTAGLAQPGGPPDPGATGGPPDPGYNQGPPPGNNQGPPPAGMPSTGNWSPDSSRPRIVASQVYSSEGILNTCRQAESLSNQLWDGVKNQPFLPERRDEYCRQALLGVVEHARNLRVSLEEGVTNPRDKLEYVLRARDDLRRAEPQYNLPVAVRPAVPSLLEALDQIEGIYWQLNP